MLVLLKIPIVYLCMVVWWAIRAEPRDEQPAIDGAGLGYSSLARLDTIEPSRAATRARSDRPTQGCAPSRSDPR